MLVVEVHLLIIMVETLLVVKVIKQVMAQMHFQILEMEAAVVEVVVADQYLQVAEPVASVDREYA